MGRPRKEQKEKLVEIPCKVPLEVADMINAISIEKDRSRSQVARKMIIRGLTAYKRDGEIDEIEQGGTKARPSQKKARPAPKITGSKKRQKDKIDEAIDAALSFGGGPVSKKDRETIRKILEEESENNLEEE